MKENVETMRFLYTGDKKYKRMYTAGKKLHEWMCSNCGKLAYTPIGKTPLLPICMRCKTPRSADDPSWHTIPKKPNCSGANGIID